MGLFERFRKREIRPPDASRDAGLHGITYHKVRYFYNKQANTFYVSHNGDQEMMQIRENDLPEPVRTCFFYEPPDATRQQTRYSLQASA